MWCLGEGFGGWGWFVGIGMIIFWVIFITLAVWLALTLIKNNRGDNTLKALNIAKERYAKGELSKDEYDQYRKNLKLS